jgi:hypothetical protein
MKAKPGLVRVAAPSVNPGLQKAPPKKNERDDRRAHSKATKK